MTGYTAGILSERVRIHCTGAQSDTEYGRTTAAGEVIERWAAVDWTRGTKALREGAVDAYDTIMVRMRYDAAVTRDCRIEHNGALYRILSLHADRKHGTIQITATEIIGE